MDEKDNRIQNILNAVGVIYTHRNEDLIAESAIEGQRHKNAVEVRCCVACWIANHSFRLGKKEGEEVQGRE